MGWGYSDDAVEGAEEVGDRPLASSLINVRDKKKMATGHTGLCVDAVSWNMCCVRGGGEGGKD